MKWRINMGFLEILTIILVVGKLLGYFAISWTLALLPIIIEIVIVLAIMLFMLFAVVAIERKK